MFSSMRPILLLVLFPIFCCAVRIPVPSSSTEAIRGVLQRLPSWIADEFDSIVVGDDEQLADGHVRITVDDSGKKTVTAGTATAALYGINFVLQKYCFTQITWNNSSFGDRCIAMEEDTIELESPSVRYFGNPCTFSYSFAWWQWKDWEKMIDWIALNGFNMVLASVGQEAIWRDVFMEMGVPRKELEDYFTGPAYLAWHRMGNLKSWGGPLSDSFMDSQLELNKKIVTRLAELGIVPVLPTFAGFVPDALVELYPEFKFVQNSCWNNFSESSSCLQSVHPSSPLFAEIAKRFMEKQNNIYGAAYHVYSADPLNEMMPSKMDLRMLKETSQAVYQGCATTDPLCVWVLQSWTFSYDHWTNKDVKAFLSGVPLGSLLVLDMYAEHRPLWIEFHSFYGHSFVWCMLHNFGGTTEMRGNLRHLNKGYQLALTSPNSMVGAGLTMEAINQNYVVHQFMIDRMWQQNLVPMHSWLESFVTARYGLASKAAVKTWALLLQSFYAEPVNKLAKQRFSVFLYQRPKFNGRIKYWFDSSVLAMVVNNFIELKGTLGNNVLYRLDFNDVMREFLQYDLGNKVILGIYEGFGLGDSSLLTKSCIKMTTIFQEIELHTNYDLADLEESALALSTTPAEAIQFSRNVRDLLTTWGPNGQIMDYGRREWAGLIGGYYRERWNFFCEWLLSEDRFNRTLFEESIFEVVEKSFVLA